MYKKLKLKESINNFQIYYKYWNQVSLTLININGNIHWYNIQLINYKN